MLCCFVGPPFPVLVGWSLVVVFLFFSWFTLWDGFHEFEGDCPVNLLDADERFSVEGESVESGPSLIK